MQIYDLKSSTAKAACDKAVLPIIFQGAITLTDADGTTPKNITTVTAGNPAYYGGLVRNVGCQPVEITLKYLGGADCDACTTDTLTTTDITVSVGPDEGLSLPDGWWQQADVVTVDTAGDPAALAAGQTQTVKLDSFYTPACPDCGKLAV